MLSFFASFASSLASAERAAWCSGLTHVSDPFIAATPSASHWCMCSAYALLHFSIAAWSGFCSSVATCEWLCESAVWAK